MHRSQQPRRTQLARTAASLLCVALSTVCFSLRLLAPFACAELSCSDARAEAAQSRADLAAAAAVEASPGVCVCARCLTIDRLVIHRLRCGRRGGGSGRGRCSSSGSCPSVGRTATSCSRGGRGGRGSSCCRFATTRALHRGRAGKSQKKCVQGRESWVEVAPQSSPARPRITQS